MKTFMMIVGEFLTEAKFTRVETPYGDVKVYKNPTAELVRMMGEVRGIVDEGDDLYVWDAYAATHDQISRELGSYNQMIFSTIGNKLEGGYQVELSENPHFRRAFPGYII